MVKGVKFVGLRDAGDQVEVAKACDAAGANEFCFLAFTASQENRCIILVFGSGGSAHAWSAPGAALRSSWPGSPCRQRMFGQILARITRLQAPPLPA